VKDRPKMMAAPARMSCRADTFYFNSVASILRAVIRDFSHAENDLIELGDIDAQNHKPSTRSLNISATRTSTGRRARLRFRDAPTAITTRNSPGSMSTSSPRATSFPRRRLVDRPRRSHMIAGARRIVDRAWSRAALARNLKWTSTFRCPSSANV
jgi:hypothetical protein